MNDSHWPKIYQWTPHDKKKRERPQQSWKSQVKDFMRSRNMEEDMAENRQLWHLGMDRQNLVV